MPAPDSVITVSHIALLLSGIGTLVAVIGLVRTFLVSRAAEMATLRVDFDAIHERLSLLELKMGMFWRLAEEHLSTLLKRPTHLEMDDLLDKLKAHTLSLAEAYRLRTLLRRTYLETEAAHAQERLVAILVLAALDALVLDLEKAART